MQHQTLLRAHDIGVRFGATVALAGVDIDVRRGEVHAVVGENGAGKSTLLNVVSGAVRPQQGTVERTGLRLAWVPQEPLLPADLTAEQWIFLGRELHGWCGWLWHTRMRAAAEDALRTVGCAVGPLTRLGSLPSPQRKQVQLARAVSQAPDVLLLDEPTAVLGDSETRHLFRIIEVLKQRGAGVLYVSHRLNEVLTIADRVTVLRDGHHVSTDSVGAVDSDTLIHRMVGRSLQRVERRERRIGTPVLELMSADTAHVPGAALHVCAGEVVGLAGLVGAGRSELLEAIAGLRPLTAGRIVCTTPPLLVPEDRSSKGLIPTLGLRENLFVPAGGWILWAAGERRATRHWIDTLDIRASSSEAAIDSLSGGNQQKLLLARALRREPRLLLLDEPTAGIDVGAKADIHAIIRELAARGTAIILASSDLGELLALSDRIIALREGAIIDCLDVEEASEPVLAALITGASPLSARDHPARVL